MNDFFETLGRDRNSFRYAREKRADFLRAGGTAKGDEKHGVVRNVHSGSFSAS
jgi:hypothetical protein